jgi:integrase/recombinase XerD
MAGQAKILSPQEIQAVFKLLESPRDKALFAVGIYTGLRISEIISLKQCQLFTTNGVKCTLVLYRLKKKNTVYSEIPIVPKPRQALLDYRKELESTDWLFPSDESECGHISRAAAHNVLTQVFKILKLEGAKTHSMRRTLLTALSRQGVPLRTVQDISDHSNLAQLQAQLQAYLEVHPEDKHKALGMLKY